MFGEGGRKAQSVHIHVAQLLHHYCIILQPLGLEEFQHLTEVSPTKSNLPVMEQCTTGTAESP